MTFWRSARILWAGTIFGVNTINGYRLNEYKLNNEHEYKLNNEHEYKLNNEPSFRSKELVKLTAVSAIKGWLYGDFLIISLPIFIYDVHNGKHLKHTCPLYVYSNKYDKIYDEINLKV
jgi:hypothetical protein